MSKKLFVEKREQGDLAVRKPGSKRASAVLPKQKEAIAKAKDLGAAHPDVERVRNTKGGSPDNWRKSLRASESCMLTAARNPDSHDRRL